MKALKSSIYIVLLFVSPIGVCAQQASVAAGGNAIGNDGSVSYSVGQINYIVISGSNGSSIEGVQQPYEISVVTNFDEIKCISLSASIYPNPTEDNLTLYITNLEYDNLSFQLYDLNGKMLITDRIPGTQTQIRMNGLAPSIYLLKVMQTNTEIKTFKIIKH